MKMRTLTLALVAVAGLGLVPLALAQSPMQVHETRVTSMKDIGGNLRTINESQKEVANHAKIVAAATVIQNHAKNIPSWFPPGTDMAAVANGGKNHAKVEIWANKAEFDGAAKGLETVSADMIRIAAGTDNNAVQEQFKKFGPACGACHSKFRAPLQ
ncbi:MAG: cytochrome c [Alphaproteobacteria bacterium]|nr:cytochrome c [Alphaproteobacteria bacterium]